LTDDVSEENVTKKTKKKRRPGLSQGRYALLSRGQKPNPILRTKSYSVTPNTSTSISSGSVILAIGLSVGFTIPVFNFESQFGVSGFFIDTPNVVGGLMILIIQFTVGALFDIEEIIGSLIVGWFLGGVVASLIYNQDGKRGPFYSSGIAISIMLGVSFIMGVIFFTKGEYGGNITTVFIPMIVILLISLFMAVISIPLIIVAMIGYRVGGYLSNV
jgi:hypothetical protein